LQSAPVPRPHGLGSGDGLRAAGPGGLPPGHQNVGDEVAEFGDGPALRLGLGDRVADQVEGLIGDPDEPVVDGLDVLVLPGAGGDDGGFAEVLGEDVTEHAGQFGVDRVGENL
jgi:hypothetical protein